MSRGHGKDTRVLVNDSHLSGYVSGWRFEHRRLLSDDTNLLSIGDQFKPGQIAGSVGITGMFDAAASGITEVLDTARTTDNGLVSTFYPFTPAVGSMVFLARGNVSGLDYPAQVKDLVRVSLTGQPEDGVDIGTSLHILGAETADGDGSSVDNTASSANGAVAILHATAFTGLTDIVIKVQHSTDNSSWSDLITFATVTGETWEYATASGTVNRYLRANWDVTGTGSCTFELSAARR